MSAAAADILPTSVPKVTRGVVMRDGEPWVPIFCANCGCDGGWIPEAANDFAFYLCEGCAERWSPLAGTMLVPDEAFWSKVNEAQLERYGRILDPSEIVRQLDDPESMLSKLARDRYAPNTRR